MPRLMLLDTASLYFRAFYGVPDSIRRSDGTPVNAVRGLMDMIARLVTDYEATHVVACWDNDWRPQWRVDLIPSYKSHRVAEIVPNGPDVEVVPDPLEAQIPMIRKVLELAGIAVVGADEHEADDVVGTYASQAAFPTDVVTGDRDLFQLVDDQRGVRVIYTARGMKNLELVTEVVVVGKYKVLPQQYADFATLRGDASDGLPGVAGIGEKPQLVCSASTAPCRGCWRRQRIPTAVCRLPSEPNCQVPRTTSRLRPPSSMLSATCSCRPWRKRARNFHL